MFSWNKIRQIGQKFENKKNSEIYLIFNKGRVNTISHDGKLI